MSGTETAYATTRCTARARPLFAVIGTDLPAFYETSGTDILYDITGLRKKEFRLRMPQRRGPFPMLPRSPVKSVNVSSYKHSRILQLQCVYSGTNTRVFCLSQGCPTAAAWERGGGGERVGGKDVTWGTSVVTCPHEGVSNRTYAPLRPEPKLSCARSVPEEI
eukprot:3937867-Rhodomonas_salina.1